MRKILTIITVIAAALSFSANAQRAGEYNLGTSDANFSKSGIFSEIGLGVACGDIESDLGLSVGLGYRYHFGSGLCWDILRVAYYAPSTTTAFEEGSSMRFLSGIRYNSAPVLADKPLYATFAAGYQMNVNDFESWHGFAYKFGVGVVLNPAVSLGLMWEGNVAHYDFGFDSANANFGIFGVKLGIQF